MITRYYGRRSAGDWQKGVFDLLKRFKDEPDSDFAVAFREAAAHFKKGDFVRPEETLAEAGKAYGKIWNDAGVADYFQGLDYNRFYKILAEESPEAYKVWEQEKHEDNLRVFREAADHYLKKAKKSAPAAPPDAKPPVIT